MPPAGGVPPSGDGRGGSDDGNLVRDAIAAAKSGSLASFLEGLTDAQLDALGAAVEAGGAGNWATTLSPAIAADAVRRSHR